MFFRRRKPSDSAPAESAPTGAEPAATGPPSTQFLTGDSSQDRRTVQVLLEAIARVSESRDLESLLIDIVDNSIEITGTERGLLILRGPKGELQVRVARQRGNRPVDETVAEVRFSTSVAKRVLEGASPLRATVQTESEALDLGRSVYDLKLRAVMCVPLTRMSDGDGGAPGRAIGVLYVDSRAATRQFSQRDLGLFAALAQHISIALENARLHVDSLERVRLEQSLELASAIQRDLMPPIPEGVEGWELHGWYRPAERTAGDFYDFVPTKAGPLAVMVGDVTGHGIGPALITAMAQASLRSYLRVLDGAGQAVTMLNQDVCDRVEDGRFLTLVVGLVRSDGSVAVINCGHASPVVWRARSGSFERVPGGGPALGMLPGEDYSRLESTVALERGDVLVLYSDGLTESRHPDRPEDLFGEEGLERALAAAAAEGATARAITLGIVESALELSGGNREDDITLVVMRRR